MIYEFVYLFKSGLHHLYIKFLVIGTGRFASSASFYLPRFPEILLKLSHALIPVNSLKRLKRIAALSATLPPSSYMLSESLTYSLSAAHFNSQHHRCFLGKIKKMKIGGGFSMCRSSGCSSTGSKSYLLAPIPA